jgi:hypothetical protein
MKKVFPLLFLPALILVFSCRQDPVFLGISHEEEPKDPRIKGTPTNIVVFDQWLCVTSIGSESVQRYNKDGWTAFPDPGGKVWGLAATEKYLYALTGSSESPSFRRMGKDGKWSDISTPDTGGYMPVNAYGAPGVLFAGAYKVEDGGPKYALFYLKDGDTALSLLMEDCGKLMGAAWDGANYYYIATEKGIYAADAGPVLKNGGKPVWEGEAAGIISLNPGIAAAGRNGTLLYDPQEDKGAISFKQSDKLVDIFTGAMTAWTGKDGEGQERSLLLLGIQSSSSTSYTHGYREITLDNGKPLLGSFHTPGEDEPSTVEDKYKYKDTIGQHPLSSILQTPAAIDDRGIIFASTSKSGLWSCRDKVWNAEPE